MKILNFLNISNISNLQADSGYVFQKLLMNEVLRQRPDWEFYFISPPNTEHLDERIHIIEMDFGCSKFEVRFNFPWYELKDKLKQILPEINLIYVNQSEQTANFKALATTLSPDRRIPIVTYFHYLPIEPPHLHFDSSAIDYDRVTVPEGANKPLGLRFEYDFDNYGMALPVFMRQIEAMQLSDYCITCSEFGIDLLVSNAQRLIPTVSPKITSISPPISFEESEVGRSVDKKSGNQIVFNHRLYEHYGPKEFFEFMDWFYRDVRQDFEVILTDPTFGRSEERNRLNSSVIAIRSSLLEKPYVRLRHEPKRADYYRVLGESKISIAPLKPSALWSMSVVDSMACGLPVACPQYACFPEIIGANNSLLFSSSNELSVLLQRLFDDESFHRQSSEYCITRAKNFRVEETARKFITVFEEVVDGGG